MPEESLLGFGICWNDSHTQTVEYKREREREGDSVGAGCWFVVVVISFPLFIDVNTINIISGRFSNIEFGKINISNLRNNIFKNTFGNVNNSEYCVFIVRFFFIGDNKLITVFFTSSH